MGEIELFFRESATGPYLYDVNVADPIFTSLLTNDRKNYTGYSVGIREGQKIKAHYKYNCLFIKCFSEDTFYVDEGLDHVEWFARVDDLGTNTTLEEGWNNNETGGFSFSIDNDDTDGSEDKVNPSHSIYTILHFFGDFEHNGKTFKYQGNSGNPWRTWTGRSNYLSIEEDAKIIGGIGIEKKRPPKILCKSLIS